MKPIDALVESSREGAITDLRVWTAVEMRMETGNLNIRARVGHAEARLVRCVLRRGENVIHEERFPASDFEVGVSFREIPMRLWWPHSLGTPEVFVLTVELLDAQGALLDDTTRRVGFRHVGTVDVSSPETWRMEVNGRPVELKVATWTPKPAGCETEEILERLELHRHEDVSVLRAWEVEAPCFYDMCDALGVFVGQVFPAGATDGEARELVSRLQHHPSLLVWIAPRGETAGPWAAIVDELDPTRRLAAPFDA